LEASALGSLIIACPAWKRREEREEKGPGRVSAPLLLLAVPNVTAHPQMASVPTSYYLMWHYNCFWIVKG